MKELVILHYWTWMAMKLCESVLRASEQHKTVGLWCHFYSGE